MKIIFLLAIFFIHITLFAQEKEEITSETKKWKITTGIYVGNDRIPMLNFLYTFSEKVTFSLSIRRKDIRHVHELLNADTYIFNRRYDTWRDTLSSRNIIAPGIEWNVKNNPFYLTTRLGIEDYRYSMHTESLYYSEGRGYTSYRTYHTKSHTQKAFGELGIGFRFLFWDTLLFSMESGLQKILKTKYTRDRYDDYTYYQNSKFSSSYTFFSSDPETKNSYIYATISLGIAF